MLNLPFGQIGRVIDEQKLIIKAQNGKTVVEVDLNSLKKACQKPLNW